LSIPVHFYKIRLNKKDWMEDEIFGA